MLQTSMLRPRRPRMSSMARSVLAAFAIAGIGVAAGAWLLRPGPTLAAAVPVPSGIESNRDMVNQVEELRREVAQLKANNRVESNAPLSNGAKLGGPRAVAPQTREERAGSAK